MMPIMVKLVYDWYSDQSSEHKIKLGLDFKIHQNNNNKNLN